MIVLMRLLQTPSPMPVPLTRPSIDDAVSLARYPFLPQATPWISALASEHNIDLDELLDGSSLDLARRRGRMRLIDTVDNDDGVEAAGLGDIHTEEGRILEAFSFYYSRLIICASEDERLISRWAQAEASRAEMLLSEDKETLPLIAKTYLNNVEQNRNGIWKVGLADFIEICPKITGARWRLANCDVKEGWVTLHQERTYSSTQKIARLLRERVKQEIEKNAKEKVKEITTELAIRLAEPLGMVIGLVNARQSEVIELSGAGEEDWPPCMRNAIVQLSDGVNVNHSGRLFLASISRTVGLPRESCVDLFRSAPDFSETTTSYQVDHIYDREYTPAGCSNLKVNHNCPVTFGDDTLCDKIWMDHPLKYVRAKRRWRQNSEAVEQNDQSNNATDA